MRSIGRLATSAFVKALGHARSTASWRESASDRQSQDESRAKQRTDDAQIPLPGGTGGKPAAADTGDTGPSGMAEGDADADLQRNQYARRRYDQALPSVCRCHDLRVPDSS